MMNPILGYYGFLGNRFLAIGSSTLLFGAGLGSAFYMFRQPHAGHTRDRDGGALRRHGRLRVYNADHPLWSSCSI